MQTKIKNRHSWARWYFALCLMIVLQAVPLVAVGQNLKPAKTGPGESGGFFPSLYVEDDMIGPDHPVMRVFMPVYRLSDGYNMEIWSDFTVYLETKHKKTKLISSKDFANLNLQQKQYPISSITVSVIFNAVLTTTRDSWNNCFPSYNLWYDNLDNEYNFSLGNAKGEIIIIRVLAHFVLSMKQNALHR